MRRNKGEVQPRDVESPQSETFLRHRCYCVSRGRHGGNDNDDGYTHHHCHCHRDGDGDDDRDDDTKVDLTGFAKASNKESLCSRVSNEPPKDTYKYHSVLDVSHGEAA